MFEKITIIFLLGLGLLINPVRSNCTLADSYECSTSLCANFQVRNGTCRSNPSAACTPNSQVYQAGTCVNCSTLSITNCSSICPDYFYTNSCTACWVTFGDSCVACTSKVCTYCAYRSQKVLASDSLSCVSSSCNILNCQKCYSANGLTRCQKCNTGFTVDDSYNCVSSTCSISYCTTCKDSSSCAGCTTNYKLSADQTGCIPLCNDTNCLTCLKPSFCGTCVDGYEAKNGVCVLDCTKSLVANCKICLTLATCKDCNTGFLLANGGASCIVKCNDENCDFCSSASTCLTCQKGYFLSSSGLCRRNICPVQYCETCLSVNLCQNCTTGFTLSSDQTACTPTCRRSISNCNRCSDASTCSTCDTGYQLSGNQCSRICSMGNCSICATRSTCEKCEADYVLSQDKTACQLICLVANCLTCPSAKKCDACATGYSKVTSNNQDYCVAACGQGQINMGSPANPVCQPCSSSIPNCMNCHLTTSFEVVCDACPKGYFVDGAGNCQLCNSQISNCWDCSDPSTCTDCVAGYVLSKDQCVQYACSSTVLNCQNCQAGSPNVCASCQPGFTLNNSTGSCEVNCKPTYIFDFKQSGCICAPGTYESDGICNSCDDYNCYKCSMLGCSLCNEGYFLSGTTCLQCSANCIYCTSATTCLKCKDGFSVFSDGKCVSVPEGATDPAGDIYPCPTGCSICQISGTGDPLCTVAADGYSIVASTIIACDPSCRSCSDTTNTSCTACYPSKYLIGGQCRGCVDPFATACLQGNPNFSTQCQPGYTPSFYTVGSTSFGGTCKACATDCLQCDSAGPGNCDSGRCATGFVIVVGTKNCTACLGGCPLCDSYNPAICKKCPDRQYSSNGECLACGSTCATCSDATTCSSCNSGFSLLSGTCLANPANCLGLSSEKICASCFQGYLLSSDKSSCNIDTACNATSKCFVCSTGQYLQKGKCFTCSNLPANCLACNSNSKCIKCADGYFVSSGVCSKCADNCTKCSSSNFCIEAADGYYIQLSGSRKKNGAHEPCRTPCKTCEKDEKNCLSCVDKYVLNGTQCLGGSRILVEMLINGDGSQNSFLQNNVTAAQSLYSGASNINRLFNGLCKLLPSNFDVSTPEKCYDALKLAFLGSGSLKVKNSVIDGGYSNPTDALNGISSAMTSGTNFDGLVVLSSSFQAVGYTTPAPVPNSSSGVNLALVLGLSIPLTVLLILIIAAVALRSKEEIVEVAEMADRDDPADSVNAVQNKDADRI